MCFVRDLRSFGFRRPDLLPDWHSEILDHACKMPLKIRMLDRRKAQNQLDEVLTILGICLVVDPPTTSPRASLTETELAL